MKIGTAKDATRLGVVLLCSLGGVALVLALWFLVVEPQRNEQRWQRIHEAEGANRQSKQDYERYRRSQENLNLMSRMLEGSMSSGQ